MRTRPAATRSASAAVRVAFRIRQSFRIAAAGSGVAAAESWASIFCATVGAAGVASGAALAAGSALLRSSVASATASPSTASCRERAVIDAAARCSTDSVSCSPWRRR